MLIVARCHKTGLKRQSDHNLLIYKKSFNAALVTVFPDFGSSIHKSCHNCRFNQLQRARLYLDRRVNANHSSCSARSAAREGCTHPCGLSAKTCRMPRLRQGSAEKRRAAAQRFSAQRRSVPQIDGGATTQPKADDVVTEVERTFEAVGSAAANRIVAPGPTAQHTELAAFTSGGIPWPSWISTFIRVPRRLAKR